MALMEPAFDGVTVVSEPIPLSTLHKLAADGFGDLVKAVVDVQRRILAVGGDLHSDGEAALLDSGSRQADVWGINLYPAQYGADGWIEYDSLINIRPSQRNRSRTVEDPEVRKLVVNIVGHLVAADV
jgi:hypothetical protein